MSVTAATPSNGYTVAYDLDGVLKQKDSAGVITPIASSQTLQSVLKNNNNSGTFSIVMGATSSIFGSRSGRIQVDNFGTSSVVISATANGILSRHIISLAGTQIEIADGNRFSSISAGNMTFSMGVGTTTYSTFIQLNGERLVIGNLDTTVGAGGLINVFDTGKTWDGLGSINKAYVHINTFSASTVRGVMNSVVIGGQFMTASRSNYVYLGNWVNVNNAYTLPNKDGLNNQVLTTNGSGTVSWATFSIDGVALSKILATDNNSATYSIVMGPTTSIVLGSASTISSSMNNNTIRLDWNNTNRDSILISTGDMNTNSYIGMSTQSYVLSTQNFLMTMTAGVITTYNGKGIQYTGDYTSGFESNSLVTKSYVDLVSASYSFETVVFVDPSKGNDTTGQINLPAKPFQTISSATIAMTSSSYSSLNRGLIYLRKGSYTDTVYMENNVDYYGEAGVVFTQNGFRNYNNTNSTVYGHASFVGSNSSLVPLIIEGTCSVVFNFDKIDNTNSIARIYGLGANVRMFGKSMKTLASAGYGISIEQTSNVGISVVDEIISAYNTIRFTNLYSGTTTIETPRLRVNGNLGGSGVISGAVRALFSQTSVSGSVKVRADIEDFSTSGASDNAAVYIGSGNFDIKGGINGNNSIGLYLSNDGLATVTVDGNISGRREAVYNVNDFSDVRINNSVIKSDGLGSMTHSVFMGSSASMYINNSTVYNGLTNSGIILVNRLESMLGIYNTLAYSPGSDGTFITCTFSDYTIGFHNVRSNKDNGDNISDLFDPSGFIYDPYLFVPKY